MGNPKYTLAYDIPGGLKNVVFKSFLHKPSTKEMSDAMKEQSEVLGYPLKVSDVCLWGPVDG